MPECVETANIIRLNDTELAKMRGQHLAAYHDNRDSPNKPHRQPDARCMVCRQYQLIDDLKAELVRVAPFLAIHGFGGYTMGPALSPSHIEAKFENYLQRGASAEADAAGLTPSKSPTASPFLPERRRG